MSIKNYECFDPQRLYLSPNVPDEYKLIRNKVNKISEKGSDIYMLYKRNQFLFANFDSYKQYISNYADILGIKDKKFNDKKETLTSIYNIIGRLCDDLLEKLNATPHIYLVSLLSNLEYNFHLTLVHIEWITKRLYNNEFLDEPIDDLAKFFINTLEQYKEYNKDICLRMIEELHNSFTLEKQSFQRIIKLLYNLKLQDKSSNDFFDSEIDENTYIEIIEIGTAISKLCNVVEQIDNGITNPINLKICDNGDIEIDNSEDFDFPEKFMETMSKKHSFSIPEEIKKQIDEICSKHMGITRGDIFKLSNTITKLYNNADEFLIGTRDDFIQLVSYSLECSTDVAQKIVDFLTPTIKINDFSWINERPIKKCLFTTINNFILCPVGIFEYSLLLFHTEIAHVDGLEDGEMKFELKETQKKINLLFEKSVNNYICNNLINCKTICNVDNNQIPIVNTKRRLGLDGEVDILLFYKNNLFVLECKNFSVRLDSQQVKNEFRKFRKAEKNFTKKVNSINNEKESVLRYMGVENIEFNSINVRGVYVTSIFSLASHKANLKFDVVALSDLIEYIIKTK
jgi:rRNA-processing protein FCF1